MRLLEVKASQGVLVVKNLPASAGDVRDADLTPGLGRSHGEGHGNPFQYSCLKNPMERGAWWATVHGLQRVGHDQMTKHSTANNTLLAVLL